MKMFEQMRRTIVHIPLLDTRKCGKRCGSRVGCGDFSGEGEVTALSENLERLEEAIDAACRAAGRARGEVELMAVSKTFPAEAIAEAAALGLTLFGENRVQEFSSKVLRAAESGTWAVRERLRVPSDWAFAVE